MKKKLEALELIKEHCKVNGLDITDRLSYEHLLKALTPPTEKEVCEALSEYFVIFNFYYQDKFFYRSDGIKYIYPLVIDGFTEIQLYDGHLPPHLIKMIGRFYEQEEEMK